MFTLCPLIGLRQRGTVSEGKSRDHGGDATVNMFLMLIIKYFSVVSVVNFDNIH